MSQLSIPVEVIEIDIQKKESRTQEFLSKNPNGRVPLLQVGDKYLPESNAALWYLAKDSDLLPSTDFEHAQVLQWMFFEQYSHEPNIATVRYWVSILKAESKYSEYIPQKMKAGYAALDVMENHLSSNSYFVGGKYSIADIALYAYTHVAHEGGFDLSGYENIRSWFTTIESQSNYVSLQHS